MSVSVDPCASPPPGTLSCYVTTATAVVAAITFSASGAAPTPLYHEYQEHFGLTEFMITIIFAAYVLFLLLALLRVGSLSDYIGRRPVILAALALNVLAMVLFMTAGSAAALIVARAIHSFATGLAVTTLAATILDTDKERAPVLNSFTAFAGLSAGTLGAGALVTFAPAQEQFVYVVLLVLCVVEAAILWFMPETATTKPGALASLRPRVHVPRIAWATFVAVTPVNIASWSLGGFYFLSCPRSSARPQVRLFPSSVAGRCDSDLLRRRGRGGAPQARSGEDDASRHRHVDTRRADDARRRPVPERGRDAVRNDNRRHRLRHGLLRNASERAAICPTGRTRWPAVCLFRRGLSFLQSSCTRGRLPRTHCRSDAHRRSREAREGVIEHHITGENRV
jgi:Major Facilitator Superfamily